MNCIMSVRAQLKLELLDSTLRSDVHRTVKSWSNF